MDTGQGRSQPRSQVISQGGSQLQPSVSERLAAAWTARMRAPRSPEASSSARPTMVVPAGLVTRSFSSAGCVRLPSPEPSKTCNVM